jgi:hypothetical protein
VFVHFTDDDGNVHGSASHEINLTPPEGQETEGLYAATAELRKQVIRYVENIHFEIPNAGQATQQVTHGIADTLARGTSGAPDESIEQG